MLDSPSMPILGGELHLHLRLLLLSFYSTAVLFVFVSSVELVNDTAEQTKEWRNMAAKLSPIYNGSALGQLYTDLLGKEHTKLPYTWLRAKSYGESTQPHADYYYFRKFTNLYSENWEANSAASSNCLVCNGSENEDKLLLCDLCNGGYHTYCLSPPMKKVTKDCEWHCQSCCEEEFPYWNTWISMVKNTQQ